MFDGEQRDESGNDLLDRKAGQRVFVAHDEQLTHLDDRLQLLTFIALCLQTLQQLMSFAT